MQGNISFKLHSNIVENISDDGGMRGEEKDDSRVLLLTQQQYFVTIDTETCM